MTRRPSLAVTMGDPAGIGPLVTVAALQRSPDLLQTHRIVVTGCPDELRRAAERLEIRWNPILIDRGFLIDASLEPGQVGVVAVEGSRTRPAIPGRPTIHDGRIQIEAVDEAIGLVADGFADALVTGPVSKAAIARTGVPFVGHTEHLARAAGVAPEDVTMMFAGPRVRVSLVTTHLPITEVSATLSRERISATITRTVDAFRRWWKLEEPRVVVLGLNPHAGEEGMFGSEEKDVIGPAVESARATLDGATVEGPLPSETGLRGVVEGRWDCAVAHYHDQATIPCKLLDMGRSVNVTLGLPYLRASVDHGVAYDAARSGDADPGSMVAALSLAASLTG